MDFVEFGNSLPGECSDTCEAIIGPLFHAYLACYSVSTDQGYLGYAKICAQRPSCVWEAVGLRKVVAGPCYAAEDAIRAVMDLASDQLAMRLSMRGGNRAVGERVRVAR